MRVVAVRTCDATVRCWLTIRRMPRAHAPGTVSYATFTSGWGKSAAVHRGRAPAAKADSVTPMTVAYHDSCHLVHGQKIAREPRALLALIPDVRLVPLSESTWCCGAAGVYAITQPQQAELLLARKVRHIAESGAERARDRKSGLPAADCAGARGPWQRD